MEKHWTLQLTLECGDTLHTAYKSKGNGIRAFARVKGIFDELPVKYRLVLWENKSCAVLQISEREFPSSS